MSERCLLPFIQAQITLCLSRICLCSETGSCAAGVTTCLLRSSFLRRKLPHLLEVRLIPLQTRRAWLLLRQKTQGLHWVWRSTAYLDWADRTQILASTAVWRDLPRSGRISLPADQARLAGCLYPICRSESLRTCLLRLRPCLGGCSWQETMTCSESARRRLAEAADPPCRNDMPHRFEMDRTAYCPGRASRGRPSTLRCRRDRSIRSGCPREAALPWRDCSTMARTATGELATIWCFEHGQKCLSLDQFPILCGISFHPASFIRLLLVLIRPVLFSSSIPFTSSTSKEKVIATSSTPVIRTWKTNGSFWKRVKGQSNEIELWVGAEHWRFSYL